MTKKLTSILIAIVSYFEMLSAANYAFLISAGNTDNDYTLYNSEYWYDLYLAYEQLLSVEQYDSTNVFVFYGFGDDYNSCNSRYRKELHHWGQITDYNNSYNTLDSVLTSLNPYITEDDNLCFYWIVGHGLKESSSDDSYRVYIENYNEFVDKEHLYSLINRITHYNKRKIFWMTCYSGSIGGGSYNLKNDKTSIVTSSSSNEPSFSFTDSNDDVHSAFNYAIFSLSTGKFANGMTCDLSQVCYGMTNIDSLFSINELYTGINNYSYLVVNTTQCPLNPCLFDIGGISDNIYIGEKKELRNVTININRAYWIDDMEIKNVQLDNSITTIDVDNQCLVKKSTFVPIGSSILIK